jgi:competence protein ComEC
VRNDDSLTLVLQSGVARVVLPGDIGVATEAELQRRLAFEPGALTILKVPHHGSAGSSSRAFLEALRPALAVVSAGRGNPFGHPAAPALARYRDLGVPVLRTDCDGAVAVLTDGRRVQALRWNAGEWEPVWRSPDEEKGAGPANTGGAGLQACGPPTT